MIILFVERFESSECQVWYLSRIAAGYILKHRIGKKCTLDFLRQHPVIYEARKGEYFFYIPDFYCAQKKLVIELNGEIHKFQREKDQHREEVLKELNLKILRITNAELKNMQAVLDKIIAELNILP